jgi:hypothetical protein
LIFESTLPDGTKTITDKNLPSCSIANGVMNPMLGDCAGLLSGLGAQPAMCAFAVINLEGLPRRPGGSACPREGREGKARLAFSLASFDFAAFTAI